jgi:hypothetical protein
MFNEFLETKEPGELFALSEIRDLFPEKLEGRNLGSTFSEQLKPLKNNGEKTAKMRYTVPERESKN